MTNRSEPSSWIRQWGINFGAWTLMILIVATQTLFRLRATGADLDWQYLALLPAAYWYGWALCTPVIFAIGRKLGSLGSRWFRFFGLHTAAALAISLVMLAWYAFLMHSIGGEPQPFEELFVRYLSIGFHYDIVTYGAILGVGCAKNYRRLFHERASRALVLENQLVQTQLEVLRMQLRPHFLFNTLHAIASLVEDDPVGARRMIARLSGLLRQTLDLRNRQEIPLREELGILDGYLDIEACRFEDRLQVRRDLDVRCLEAQVPSLLLQPLVENAVRHGSEQHDGRCRIDLSGKIVDGQLELGVRDHGPGLRTSEPAFIEEGIGISNVRSRLEQLYPGRASLTLESAEGGGSRAIVRLPFHRAANTRSLAE